MKYPKARTIRRIQMMARQRALDKLRKKHIDASRQTGYNLQQGIKENA